MSRFIGVSIASQRQSLATRLSAAMVAVLLLSLITLVIFILLRGSSYFWPANIHTLQYVDDNTELLMQVFGQAQSVNNRQTLTTSPEHNQISESRWEVTRVQINAPVTEPVILTNQRIVSRSFNPGAAEITLDNGQRFFLNPLAILEDNNPISLSELWRYQQQTDAIKQQIFNIKEGHLSETHRRIAELNRTGVAQDAPARVRLEEQFYEYHQSIQKLNEGLNAYQLFSVDAEGMQTYIPLASVKHISFPNQMNVFGKLAYAVNQVWTFLTESPKQGNPTGGIFPALFGTILMVLIMTVLVTPFGVLAAIYLSEYAPNNGFTSIVRIGVSNMAGVPTIVYGVFGLGFFVYGIGGGIDAIFYSDTLPSPTFGAPGLFWASLTMALLTLPVVVVATEEGLQRVPNGIRASSYALGATKAETIWYTVLPIASPGVMTGVILAIARAAGEVAPLMLVGAVKFAPTLPVDGTFPYLHLDRQFMHLGVLIFDGAFHSQTNTQGSSMMFAACLLLLICVFGLNLIAINLRAKLRRRYSQQ